MTVRRDSRSGGDGRQDASPPAAASFLRGISRRIMRNAAAIGPCCRGAIFCLAILCASAPVRADDAAIRSAIGKRLTDWAEAFNARDAARTCDLFSADLVSTMSGRADEGRAAVCGRIAAALADRSIAVHNVPEIAEIVVSGDLAVVGLTWLVSTTRGAVTEESKERGMDIFRREADGQWRIFRFLAFTAGTSDGPPAR